MQILQTLIFVTSSLFLAILPSTKYIEGITGQPTSFFPHQAESANDRTISKLIYRGLFKYDIFGDLVPDLAEHWAISNDGLVYTVTLKENQYWSDGSRINADDIIYTSFKVPQLQGVATDKVDSKTVRFILPNKYSPFLSLLTVGIMQNGSEESYKSLTPVSSGPFRVLRIQKSGPIVKEVVLLHQNKDSNIRKLVFRYYSNEEELSLAARLGEIDGFSANKAYELENFTNYRFPLQGVYFALFFNVENESVSDVALRTKLEKVLDLEEVVLDKGIFVEGPISRSPFTDTSLTFDKYDKTIKEDLGDLTLTLKVPDIKTHRAVAKVIQDVWEDKLNVNLEIVPIKADKFIDTVVTPRDFEIMLYGQEIGRDPDRYTNWHSTQTVHPGLNLSNFTHIRSDRALEEGRNAVDNNERFTHYSEFQKVINDNVPVIFLYHPYKNYYVTEFVTGLGEKYTFSIWDRFLDFDNWERIKTN